MMCSEPSGGSVFLVDLLDYDAVPVWTSPRAPDQDGSGAAWRWRGRSAFSLRFCVANGQQTPKLSNTGLKIVPICWEAPLKPGAVLLMCLCWSRVWDCGMSLAVSLAHTPTRVHVSLGLRARTVRTYHLCEGSLQPRWASHLLGLWFQVVVFRTNELSLW